MALEFYKKGYNTFVCTYTTNLFGIAPLLDQPMKDLSRAIRYITEGEIVALEFYKKGYNTFVCTYTTNLFGIAPLLDQPMKDLSRAIRYIRANAGAFHVKENELTICGFSAGGHLCGSVCVHYEDVKDENPKYSDISNKPDAAILSYPVITSGEKAHRGSFESLLGKDASEEQLSYMSLEKHVTPDTPPCFLWQTATDETVPVENSYLFAEAGKDASEEQLSYMSLEKHVTPDTPPCFLWQTATDETVPVENSYLFAEACRANGVSYAHHVFSKGKHGLSLANEEWASGNFGGQYTVEQIECQVKAAEEGVLPLPEEAVARIKKEFGMRKKEECSEEKKRIGEPSEIECQVKAAEEGVLPLPEEAVARIKKEFGMRKKEECSEEKKRIGEPSEEVAVWPVLKKEFGMRKKEECSEEKKRIGEPSEEVAVWPVLADTWLKYNRKG